MPRKEESLGVGPDVWRDEVEATVGQEIVHEAEIGRGEALQEIAADEGEPKPKAFGPGSRQEGAPGKPFWIGAVTEVEVSNEGDPADGLPGQRVNTAVEIEEWKRGRVSLLPESGERKVAGLDRIRQSANDHFFAG